MTFWKQLQTTQSTPTLSTRCFVLPQTCRCLFCRLGAVSFLLIFYFQNTAFEALLERNRRASLSFLTVSTPEEEDWFWACKLWHLLKVNWQECLLKIKDENSIKQPWGQRLKSKRRNYVCTNTSRFWIANLTKPRYAWLFLSKAPLNILINLWGDGTDPTKKTIEP